MMSSATTVPVILLLSMTFAETSPFKVNSRIYSDVTLNFDAKNNKIENVIVDKVKTPKGNSNTDRYEENFTGRVDQFKRKKNEDSVVDNTNIAYFSEEKSKKWIDQFEQKKNSYRVSLKDKSKTAAVRTSKENVNLDVTRNNEKGSVKSDSDNSKPEYEINWKRRVKRDVEDEDIIIWDNCPGKLHYELIDGELKCVVPTESAGLSDRLLGPLEKCPKGTRRAILPDGSYMCIKKRSRRTGFSKPG